MNITIDPRIAIILLAFFSYSIGFVLGRLSK
jgi:hypothetical protein